MRRIALAFGRKFFRRSAAKQDGQGIVEYALILILSSVALVAALGMFGSELANRFDGIVDVVASL